MSMVLFLIGGFLIGAVAVTFALQNTETVIVALFSWRFESSLALIIILSLAIGALIGSLWSLPRNLKKSFQILDLKKDINKLEKELADKEITITNNVERNPKE